MDVELNWSTWATFLQVWHTVHVNYRYCKVYIELPSINNILQRATVYSSDYQPEAHGPNLAQQTVQCGLQLHSKTTFYLKCLSKKILALWQIYCSWWHLRKTKVTNIKKKYTLGCDYQHILLLFMHFDATDVIILVFTTSCFCPLL